jgi:putative folate metabolism gamma-glutamate ligase
MKITPIKTALIDGDSKSLTEILDESLQSFDEGSVLAITSKIVSLCEGSVVPRDRADKEQLIVEHSAQYLPSTLSMYGHHFTIADHTLIPTAGIDESNAQGVYVLWPKDAQATANAVRAYLKERFGVAKAGVLITDSTCQPLRRGTTGIYLAHSGFRALHNYIGQLDLFGRPFAVSQASVAGGLAAAAVLAMGEGTEQTPLALVSDLPSVTFIDADPDEAELKELHIQLDEDLFAPFLTAVEWLPGQKKDAGS